MSTITTLDIYLQNSYIHENHLKYYMYIQLGFYQLQTYTNRLILCNYFFTIVHFQHNVKPCIHLHRQFS